MISVLLATRDTNLLLAVRLTAFIAASAATGISVSIAVHNDGVIPRPVAIWSAVWAAAAAIFVLGLMIFTPYRDGILPAWFRSAYSGSQTAMVVGQVWMVLLYRRSSLRRSELAGLNAGEITDAFSRHIEEAVADDG